jgi:hypothetical protein
MKTGSMDLPLHPGKCPKWLFERMRPLTKSIATIILDSYGTCELLTRLADPMFFQALGCAIGFDWHSSGLTTTTCGALKEALSEDIGVAVAGGKGKVSRKAPEEIALKAGKWGLDAESLQKASLLAAKVDSSCVQSGHSLYHHSFLFDEEGNWAVIQQGMNAANRCARRYHWLNASDFVNEPPDKMAGSPEPEVLNLVSMESEETRKVSVDIVKDNPVRLRKYVDGQTTLGDDQTPPGDGAHFVLPERHEILECDLTEKDWRLLKEAYELQPGNYQELICLRGMGKKKLRALALLSRLIHGTKLDWKDPVKYSFAHGGKDGIPFPVQRNDYDHSIAFLRDVIEETKTGSTEKAGALKRLSQIA